MDALGLRPERAVYIVNGPTPGASAGTIFLTYRNGWFVSLGAEYRVLPWTTLRAGVGIETSPVRESLGWVGLPGADSRSLSGGLSHKLTEYLTFDLAYSYTWRDTQQIVVGPGHPDQAKFITLIPGVFNFWGGSTDGHTQVVSAALRYRFADPK